jgi:hypothetical protein
MSVISTITERISPRWEPPVYTMPMPTPPGAFKELGHDRVGREWVRHKFGEMYRTAIVDERRERLPNGPIVDLGDGTWQTYSAAHKPGTYEELLAGRTSRIPKAPKPPRMIDLVASTTIGWRTRERGWKGAIASLRIAGATVSWNGEALVVYLARDGYPVAAIREFLDVVEPMLVAHYRHEAFDCRAGRHRKPEPAITVALGNVPTCLECLNRTLSEAAA